MFESFYCFIIIRFNDTENPIITAYLLEIDRGFVPKY
jgi:hypothetical protein